MIHTIATVAVKNQRSIIDQPILLYRGDKNLEIQFLILEGAYRKYKLEGPNTIERGDK